MTDVHNEVDVQETESDARRELVAYVDLGDGGRMRFGELQVAAGLPDDLSGVPLTIRWALMRVAAAGTAVTNSVIDLMELRFTDGWTAHKTLSSP